VGKGKIYGGRAVPRKQMMVYGVSGMAKRIVENPKKEKKRGFKVTMGKISWERGKQIS